MGALIGVLLRKGTISLDLSLGGHGKSSNMSPLPDRNPFQEGSQVGSLTGLSIRDGSPFGGFVSG